MFVPKSISHLRYYSWKKLSADLVAGLVVGVVALPLAMGFAIASGVTPQAGLYTAIVAGFLISALGGSRVQIGGPTGAFVPLVYVIVAQHGLDGLALATLMAGVMLLIMGIGRWGAVVKFIPYPVTTGFTAGIAVFIFSSQINDLLGLGLGKTSPHLTNLTSINVWTLVVSALCLACLLLWPKVTRKLPAPLVAMVLGTVVVWLFNLPVETIRTCPRLGEIPETLPTLTFPTVTYERLRELMGPAFIIAVLAAIESLLSAVVADGMTGGRHKPNMELIAQGVANVACPLFGGIPATGAIARTATNIKSGARTPVAGMVHALVLLAIMLLLGEVVSYVPLCALAAVLVIAAWHMADIRSFASLLRAPRSDAIVLLSTFLLTVIFDLTIGVGVGLVLAASLFIKRMADVTNIAVVTRELSDANNGEENDPNAIATRVVPPGVEVYEVNGPFFFGVADKVKDLLRGVIGRPRVFILRMRYVPAMDATGLHALLDLRRKCAREGCTLVLAEIHTQPFIALDRSGHREEFGSANVTAHIDDALNRARELLQMPAVAPEGQRVPEVARDTGSSSSVSLNA
jgi:SulP family sulfate permease